MDKPASALRRPSGNAEDDLAGVCLLQGRQEHAGTVSGEQWQMLWVAAIRAGKVAVSDQGQHHALHCMQGKA